MSVFKNVGHISDSFENRKKVLEVKNLKKYFVVGSGKSKLQVPAVDDVTFDVYEKEVFGLVGESGCGKTTTGRTIIKLYTPTDGTVALNGQKIGAGSAGFLDKIDEYNLKAKKDKLMLYEYKKNVLEIKENYDKKIGDLKKTYKDSLDLLNKDIKKEKEVIVKYNDTLYQIKYQLELDLENLTYNFNMEKQSIVSQGHNYLVDELRKEEKILLNTLQKKSKGLKDSAALSKEAIEKEINQLKDTYKNSLDSLKKKYEPLIAELEPKLIPKDQVNKLIEVSKLKYINLIKQKKNKYIEDKFAINKPDFETIKSKIEAIEEKKKKLKDKYKEDLSAINNQKRLELSKVVKVKYTPQQKQIINSKKKEIISELEKKISIEKGQLQKVNQINKSKESLKISRGMQMIFQDPISSLNPRMTVKEIIGEGLVITGGYSKEEIARKVSNALKLVGLAPEYSNRYPHEFSGGQRQRIGIARALIMNPSFIIADEPISSLDVSIRAQVINLLTDLKDTLGLTVLFIAHDLSVVRFFCDRIAVMYAGKIVEIAPSEELFINPVHPYTISLLSAIPLPDPLSEKNRVRTTYNSKMHNYSKEKPTLRQISPQHLVLCSSEEFNKYKDKTNKEKK